MSKWIKGPSLEKLNQDIEFLTNQQKRIEPLINFLSSYMLEKLNDENNLSVEQAFSIFKFLTEYHTNAIILIIKANEVLANNGK